MRCVTWNLWHGGLPLDGGADRLPEQLAVLAGLDADVVVLAEARRWADDEDGRLRRACTELGLTGRLSRSPRTGQHLAILTRLPVRAFDATDAGFCHSFAVADLDGPTGPLRVAAVHLDALSRRRRLAESARIAAEVTGELVVVAGDFNSVGRHDPAPAGAGGNEYWRQEQYDGADVCRGPAATLAAAGLVDAADVCPDDPREPTSALFGVPLRADRVLLSGPLARRVTAHAVVPVRDGLSDHRPVVVDLDVSDLEVAP